MQHCSVEPSITWASMKMWARISLKMGRIFTWFSLFSNYSECWSEGCIKCIRHRCTLVHHFAFSSMSFRKWREYTTTKRYYFKALINCGGGGGTSTSSISSILVLCFLHIQYKTYSVRFFSGYVLGWRLQSPFQRFKDIFAPNFPQNGIYIDIYE